MTESASEQIYRSIAEVEKNGKIPTGIKLSVEVEDLLVNEIQNSYSNHLGEHMDLTKKRVRKIFGLTVFRGLNKGYEVLC